MSKQHDLIEAIRGEKGPALYINPKSKHISSLAESATSTEDLPEIHLLAETGEVKDAVDSFTTASKLAELVEDDQLSIQTSSTPIGSVVIATNSKTIIPVLDGYSITSEDPDFASELYSELKPRFEDATTHNLRTPPLSRVQETLRDEVGDAIADEFNMVLEHTDDISNSPSGPLSVVEVALLLAARNEVLLYDISKWGEDVGIASKATFSRAKSALEDAGLVETEKVPLDIGRPRLRLMAADEVAASTPKTLIDDFPSPL